MVGAAPTLIYDQGGDIRSLTVSIYNIDTQTVFLGDASVDTGTHGFPLDPGTSVDVNLHTEDSRVYGIVASGSATVKLLIS